ncbi:MAG: histidine--tRNA ligase [Planctomycetes bacterium]|nr:histidine--tRNA ligase [Planctomycetota bacterium]
MAIIELQSVKGTRDFYPEDMRLRSWLFGHFRDIARSFGYEEYDACVLEHAELYIRKAGDEITRQLYDFRDKGDRHVALRPELTPSLARMVMAKGASLPLPARWFAIPQCFRYEETQRGRKREHFQWNMDCVGLASVAAEAELMAAQAELCRRVGLKVDAGAGEPEVVWRVSNRQVLGHALEQLGIRGEQFAQVCVCIDKRDKIGDEGTLAELAKVGVDGERGAAILRLLDVRGLDALAAAVPADNPGLVALRELMELLASWGIAHLVRIDLSVIRGLSYYTGTVWEVFAQAGTFRRAIAGGGRYDRLTETLGGSPVPMVGFGFGDIPIAEVLAELGRLPALGRGLDAVVFPMSAKEFAVANRFAARLRAQGRTVVVDYACRRFKNVIERAEQDGAGRLYIIGGNEVKAGVAVERVLGGSERVENRVPLEAPAQPSP